MKLEPEFIKKTVQAGDPLSAQAWNDVVNAVGAIYAHIESSGAASVKVQVSAAGVDLAATRVTATLEGISTEAVRPVPPGTEHTFPGLPPGNYTIRAEAPGFEPATLELAVGADGVPETQNIALVKRGNFMPLTFGMTLSAALTQLASLSIAVQQVIDVTGTSVPVANPGQEFASAIVLMQLPPAGVPVAPGEFAQLLISASLQVESTVEMPSLVGLTLVEAKKALEAVGLKVGKTITKKPAPTK